MTEPTKQNPVRKIGNAIKKHERKILITTSVLSTGTALLMKTGIAQHNAFLKEHGLYEKFYDIPTEA